MKLITVKKSIACPHDTDNIEY